jgi:outer membrane receptor protein involved in Fe transport
VSLIDGLDLGADLIGPPDQSESGDVNHDPKVISTSNYGAIFAQDDWRVTRKLTLNLGLRYDFEIPRVEKSNQMSYCRVTPE